MYLWFHMCGSYSLLFGLRLACKAKYLALTCKYISRREYSCKAYSTLGASIRLSRISCVRLYSILGGAPVCRELWRSNFYFSLSADSPYRVRLRV